MPVCFFSKQPCLLLALTIGLLIQLVGCATTGKIPVKDLSATEYRQQAYHSIYEKRYADGANLLREAVALEPNGDDYLLLGDIYEVLQQYRSARNAYQKGFTVNTDDKLKQKLVFYWATLEALEFNNLDKTAELTTQLPETSSAALNLMALQAMGKNQYDAALRLTEQVTSGTAEQEMKGWAFYLAAQSWFTLGNQEKAFQSLFFAVNHA